MKVRILKKTKKRGLGRGEGGTKQWGKKEEVVILGVGAVR